DQPAHEADRLAVQRRQASLDDGRRGPAAAAAVDDAAAAARSNVEGGAPELAEQQSADRRDLRVRRLSHQLHSAAGVRGRPVRFSRRYGREGNPSSIELSNNLVYGPNESSQDRPQNRYELKATVTFIPSEPHFGGTHQLKIGTTDDWENAGTRVLQDKVAGDYQLRFNRGLPSQIAIYNFPFSTSVNQLRSQAVYVTDTYTLKRVTVNAGVRWEHYHNFYPEQSKEAGQFSATGGINSVINADLKQNTTYEYTARFERELIPNVAVTAGYVYHRIANNYNTNIQYLRPYDTWIPAAGTFTDGLTGVPVTIYT